MANYENKVQVLIDGHHGIYVPQAFAKNFDMREWHVKSEDEEVLLAGPDHEWYWDTWDDVLRDAFFIAPRRGRAAGGTLPGRWNLHLGESGDVFIVHDSMTDKDWEEWGG